MRYFAAMPERHKLYFASDFHLGVPDYSRSREREKTIVKWLDAIEADCAELFLMGDVFDFWFEYKHVVPKGYVRLFGKLAEMADSGIKIYFFKGNHDMWMFGYLEQEIGATMISNELEIERNGQLFYLHHGDGLGPGDASYKFLKNIFRSPFCQHLFAFAHPLIGMGVANYWSRHSRIANNKKEAINDEEQEWLVQYSKEILAQKHVDYFVFGHRHLPLDIRLNESSRYINLGEWIHYKSYAVFDGEKMELKYWKEQ